MGWNFYSDNGSTKAVREVATAAAAVIPTGAVVDFAGTVAPSGFLLCDGSAVSRSTYADLFSAIGTTHGVGDGATTFNLPDCRGRGRVHPDGGVGRLSSNNALGNSGGAETHALTAAQTPLRAHTHSGTTGSESAAHTHYQSWNQITNNTTGGSGNAVSGLATYPTGNQNTQATSANLSAHTHSFTTGNPSVAEANGSAHNNMQPYIVLNAIIKV